jgi:coenzyme F420-0:L-glutamate ligase
MKLLPIKTPIFKVKSNLLNFILESIPPLEEGDIIAITSKIVALSQGNVAAIKDKEKMIRTLSQKVIETPWALITLTDDGWNVNAGVDASNAKNNLILLPKNPFVIAEKLLNDLKKQFVLKKMGVLITDTKSMPLRIGTVGRSLAYAGFEPLKSYIGKKDLYGRETRLTQTNVADALAASAVLMMGEGDEQIPIVVIKKAPVVFTSKSFVNKKDKNLSLSPEKDMFKYLFNHIEHASRAKPKKRRRAQ